MFCDFSPIFFYTFLYFRISGSKGPSFSIKSLSWPLTSNQRSKLKIPYFAWCMTKYMFWGQGVQIWHWFFIFTSQRSPFMTLDLESEFETQNSLFCMMYVKYMFLGSRSSNTALIFHFDLSEVTCHDLWPLIRGQN